MNQRINETTKQWIYYSTHHWINVNKRIDESMSRMNQWCNGSMNHWASDTMNQRTNESMKQRTNESMKQRISQWMNQWINESLNQWIIEPWINESVNDQMNEWIIDGWVDGWVSYFLFVGLLLHWATPSLRHLFPQLYASSLSSYSFGPLLLWAASQLPLL